MSVASLFPFGLRGLVVSLAQALRSLSRAAIPGALRLAPPLERQTPGQQDALLDALTRAHRLAERLPTGWAEDDVRRSLCELIEATEAGNAREARIGRLLDSLARLRRTERDLAVTRRAGQDSAEAFERVLRSDVLPLLPTQD